MKVLCPHCERLLELEQFRLDGSSLIVTCAKCGQETRVTPGAAAPVVAMTPNPIPAPQVPEVRAPPRVSLASVSGASNVVVLRTASHDAVARAAAAAESPFAIPEGLCPKCVARKREGSVECPHCGVRFEIFEEATALPPKLLRDEWVALLQDWGNDSKHQQLRRKAQQLDALATVGRLYRLRQANFPEDPFAAEALTDILRLAAVPMGIPRSDELGADQRRKVITIAVGVMALFLLVILISVLMKKD
ncbi:MAG: hypothetical protein JNM17_31915 [Archangium sp.]|nr:hypothetical protein [Archangium sp.]